MNRGNYFWPECRIEEEEEEDDEKEEEEEEEIDYDWKRSAQLDIQN
jgi:hypothetical protein